MTSPLSPEAVAQMVADREAGTPGPWREAQTWRPPIGNGPHNDMVNGNIFWGYSISGSDENGGHIYPTLAAVHNFPDHVHANARRIARLPDLEAAYLTLAAESATLRASEAAALERVTRFESALTELHAMVVGECPSLLNEDSGGNGELSCQINDLLTGETTMKTAAGKAADVLLEHIIYYDLVERRGAEIADAVIAELVEIGVKSALAPTADKE